MHGQNVYEMCIAYLCYLKILFITDSLYSVQKQNNNGFHIKMWALYTVTVKYTYHSVSARLYQIPTPSHSVTPQNGWSARDTCQIIKWVLNAMYYMIH